MSTSTLLARHLSEFMNGDSMTGSSVREHIDDITFEEATTKLGKLNTIAVLVFHINYYVEAQTRVLLGQPLDAKDALSFDLLPLQSKMDWEALRASFYSNMEVFVSLVHNLSPDQLEQTFVFEKYGSYHRNLLGMTEHAHYHLGQIVVLKKLIRQA